MPKRINSKCAFCKTPFSVSLNNSMQKAKYCSNQCQKDFEWAKKKARIKKTKLFANLREAKRWLLEQFGNRCAICEKVKWCGQPIPLVLDHVDGRHDNMRVTNYRLICPNCDAQTPTYKGKNKGNGAAWRRERYLGSAN